VLNTTKMATFCAKVFKHHKKSDGSYNVKIYVRHQQQRRYLDTEHYVSDRMLGKGLTIKDPIINAQLNIKLDDYRKAASQLSR
jgi:hypothetical protein